MNLLCPNCQKMISIPDQYAGQIMKCPLCSNTFTAPALPAASAPPAGAMPANPPPASPPASGPGGPPASPSPAPAQEDVFRFASPPPEPPKVPPEPVQPPVSETPSAPSPPAGYRHTATIWISPRVVPWIGPAALLLAFVLSFFPWLTVASPAEGSVGEK